MKFSVRLAEELGERLGAAASAAGVPRSQIVTRLLERELGGERVQRPVPARIGGRRKQVFVSFDDGELAAIDAAADALGMTRNQWIGARARGGVAADRGSSLSLETRRTIRQVFDQVRRIGVNINQAVRSVNAAAMPASGMNLANAADNLARMNDDVRVEIKSTERALLAAVRVETEYWRG